VPSRRISIRSMLAAGITFRSLVVSRGRRAKQIHQG
jgi:hypothetical protein